MNEQQKVRIVELARECELGAIIARDTCDRSAALCHAVAAASAEAFRIAQESRS